MNKYIRTPQSVWAATTDLAITLVAWGGFGWLLFECVADVLRGGLDGAPMSLMGALGAGAEVMGVYVCVAAINALALCVWAQYNQYRALGNRRRRAPVFSDAHQAAHFDVPPTLVRALQAYPVATLHCDATGTLRSIEAGGNAVLPVDNVVALRAAG
jgi:poly-beta-1,6-N-acetyl-D-glucosamine biosynthesis protein PgaD